MYYHGIILGNRYWKSPPQIYTILFSHLLPWDNTWEAISDILGKYMGKDNRDDMTPSQVLNFDLKWYMSSKNPAEKISNNFETIQWLILDNDQ